MLRLRSFLFDLFNHIFTFFYLSIFFIPMLILPKRFCHSLMKTWSVIAYWSLKKIVGLDYKIIGLENLNLTIKQGPVIIACKHQSAWETIAFFSLVENLVVILKKQLMWIPIYGSYLRKMNSIAVDRRQGLKAIKQVISESQKMLAKQHSILIFPEGTRSLYQHPSKYQSGIFSIYNKSNVPVIPVALNSGKFWDRTGKIKKPGTITLKFLPSIQPGLNKEIFMAQLEQTIEDGCLSIG